MHPDLRMTQTLQALKAFRQGSLASFLPGHFKSFPQMGSRDRREVGTLVFDYFRVKRLFPDQPKEVQILLGRYLCQPQSADFFVQFWSEKLFQTAWDQETADRWEKLSNLGLVANWESYFPEAEAISTEINKIEFLKSHLSQRKLWIRMRRTKEQSVKNELEKAEIAFETSPLSPQALAVKAGTKLEPLQAWQQAKIEVQDLASQLTAQLFEPKAGERWLDACAGGGGKSLLLHDMEPSISLFVTDIRDNMLKNLHERFKKAGLRNYSQAVVDHTVLGALAMQQSFPKQFDAILADVPCSGSGTWANTPEILEQFDAKTLAEFSDKQFRIAKQLAYALKSGGRLIYLTCSVYKQENEEVVEKLAAIPELKLESMRYFQTSTEGGDVLFGAVLRKK